STPRSWEVLEFVDYDLVLVSQWNMALMKYIQRDAHRFTARSRHTGGKHVLVNDCSAACIAGSCYRRKRDCPRFPPKRMCVETRRHPKRHEVGRNVVGLDDIIYVGIIQVSPTTELNVQLMAVALCANAVPGD